MATVTGAFVILDRASRPIRRIRDEAIQADLAVKSLGSNLDKIGTSEQRQMMGNTAAQIRQLAGESHAAGQEAEQLGSRMEKVATPQTTRNIGTQSGAVKQLGREARAADRPVSDVTRGVRRLGDESKRGESKLAKFGAQIFGLRQAMMVALIPAIGLATQGISALGGGVVALIPRLTQLSGLAAPAATAITGVGLAAIAAKLAFQGLGKALSSAGTAHEKAMAKLTPEARSFVKALEMYKPVIKDLRGEAQKGLFPGLEVALRRMNAAVPMAKQLMRAGGATLGGIAQRAAGQFSSAGFLRDFQIVGDTGLHVVTRLGDGVVNLVQAFRNFLVVGAPFTRWLADTVFGWTKQIRAISETKRQTGQLSDFFVRTQQSVTVLGHVARNVFGLIHGVLHAATNTSGQLWDGIDKVTKRWSDWANSAKGQHDMRGYFDSIREPLRQIVGFVGDLAKGLGHMAGGTGFVDAMKSLRQAIPGLADGLRNIASTFGPVMFSALSQTLQLVSTLVGGAGGEGPLTTMLRLFTGVLTTVNHLVQRLPALGPILAAAFTMLAISRFTSKVGELAGKWGLVARNARAAAGAEAEATGVGTGRGPGPGGTPAAGPGGGPAGGPGGGRVSWRDRWQRARSPFGMTAAEADEAAMMGLSPAMGSRGPGVLTRAGFGARVRPRLGALGSRASNTMLRPFGMAEGAGLFTGLGGAASKLAMPALGAAADFLWPVAAFGAVTGAMQGTSGRGVGGLLQNTASGATFGLIPGAQSADAINQQGVARAQRQLGTSVPTTGAGLNRMRARLNARIADARAHSQAESVGGLFGGTGTLAHTFRVGGNAHARTQEEAERNQASLREYRKQQHALDVVGQQIHQQRVVKAQQQGAQLAIGFGQAFNVYSQHEGIHKAMRDTTTDVITQMKKMGPVGRQALGQNTLEWAREQARMNPKLWGQVHKLEDEIKKSMDRLGGHVQIVNGQILDGSTTQWKGIAAAMQTPMEQAQEKMSAAFTQIQQEAAGALVAMGFSQGQANDLIRGMEKGGKHGAAASTVAQHGATTPFSPGYLKTAGVKRRGGKKGARGMRIPGLGFSDNVPLTMGMAAPGELIVNRHTERDVDRDLAMAGRPPLGSRVGHGPGHSYAYGGRTMAPGGGGTLTGVHEGVARAVQTIMGQFPGLSVTSTTGGGHAKGSYHYKGEAVDLGGDARTMNRAARWIGSRMGGSLTEGIHNPGLSISGGKRVPSSFWGPAVWAEHANHIHVAVAGALGALRGLTGGGGGGAGGGGAQSIHLRRMQQGLGVPGALLSHGYNAVAAGVEQKVNAALGATGGGAGGSGGAPTANMRLGKRMMLAHGWGADQWPSLKALWNRESGWNSRAVNKSSGAAGIAQSLGHGAVQLGDAAGQIAWGLDYIAGRYGSPSAAEAHENSAGWYGKGGRIPGWGGWFARGGRGRFRRPTMIGVGDANTPEQVDVTPIRHEAGKGTSSGTGGAKHVHLHVHPGAVVIKGGGEKAGREAADALFDRLATLMEGMGMESEVSIG